jgi:hypothetical protein
VDALQTAEGSVGKRLLQALLLELKMQSPRFNTMNEEAQAEVIDRLRGQVDEAVREAITGIAAQGAESARVTIESITFKKGVKIVLSANSSQGILAVADEIGTSALLVLCDTESLTGDMGSVKPTPNQGDLLGGAGPGVPGPDDGDEDDED